MGERVFTKSQYAVEVTKGTAIASTAIWPGTVSVPPDRKVQFLAPLTGRRGGSTVSSVAQIRIDPLTMRMEAAYTEKLPLLFLMLLDGTVTAALGKWTFSPSLTAAGSYKSLTLEYGDDTQAYEAEYVMGRRLKISGKTGEDGHVSVELECFARQETKTTFTAGLTQGTLTPLVANLSQFYIDPTWATLGATKKTALLREFDIEITNGVHPKQLADGALTFGTYGEGELGVTASFVYEGEASAVTEYDAYKAQTARAIRLVLGSPTEGIQIDMFGRYETIQPMGQEADGNNLHVAAFVGQDDNQATPHKVAVVCNTAATTA